MPFNNKPTVAISGASGFIGGALVRHFSEKGYRVIGLLRCIPDLNSNPNIIFRAYDLDQIPDSSQFEDVDYFIHCAFSRKKRSVAGEELNRFSCQQLLRINTDHRFKKIIYISSLRADPHSRSFYGRMKSETEKLFQIENAVIVRPGLVVGNGGIYKLLKRIVTALPIIPTIQHGKQKLFYILIEDLCSALEALMRHDAKGPFTLAYSTPIEFKELVKSLATDKTLFFVDVPKSIISLCVSLFKIFSFGQSTLPDYFVNLFEDISHIKTSDLTPLGIKLKELHKNLPGDGGKDL